MAQGLGTETDVEGAKTWFQRAADHGYELAQRNLDMLTEDKATAAS